LAEYLEQRGLRVRIVNLAVRMLNDPRFDAERQIRRLHPDAFGIDLHWLPHAHGAIEVARIIKKHHPHAPVILGGLSATYYHQELMNYPEVDYVIRGDSAEEPLLQLMQCIIEGSEPHTVPNLTWRDSQGNVHANPLTHSPENLNHVLLDYGYVVKAVARYRDLASFVPFQRWLGYPITAALTCRGCHHNCVTCGGSSRAFREFYGRAKTAFRAPEMLAQDIRNIRRFSKGPIFVLGDIRQAGMDYAERFLEAINGFEGQLMFEFFGPSSWDFLQKLGQAVPNFVLEISPESHSEEVRYAFGRHYSNEELEDTIGYALEAGCHRLDLFFMIGLPKQTYQTVLDTVQYCEHLLHRFNKSGGDAGRIRPFISPLAPFLDPGSLAFEKPEAHGYRLFYRTLEEHRQALLQPSWKYVLNYETQWMNRDEIVASTYEAALRLNAVKARYGLVGQQQAEALEKRVRKAIHLIKQIDDIMTITDERRRNRLLAALKPQVDKANLSTVCDKRELELPLGWLKLDIPRAALLLLSDMLLGTTKKRAVSKGIQQYERQ
ncbi:MAG TPA: TIGR04190 family B12-binding domain/radical SAM domain protein, partial [Anaerolineae bacterium]|nr:TIGR04190 family B12-binding domain/radical SAM domain protein [Anaerolineae bacterium]